MRWIFNSAAALACLIALISVPVLAAKGEMVSSCLAGLFGGILLGVLTLKAIFYDEGRA